MDDAQTHFGPDRTSVMRLAYFVDYKPNMLHNRTQSVYGHCIARHMFDKEKRAVVEGKKEEEGVNTFISPEITTTSTYVIILTSRNWQNNNNNNNNNNNATNVHI
jgi:hypothetical protein